MSREDTARDAPGHWLVWRMDRTKGGHYWTREGSSRLVQGSGVAVLPQGSKPATPHGLARPSGGLGAPRSTTRALRSRASGVRARTKDEHGLKRPFGATGTLLRRTTGIVCCAAKQ